MTGGTLTAHQALQLNLTGAGDIPLAGVAKCWQKWDDLVLHDSIYYEAVMP